LFGNLVGGITQPLFNKRKNKSAYENALHQRDAKISNFQQNLINAVGEVSNSYNDIYNLSHQKKIINNRLSNLDNVIADAQNLYEYGEVNALDVITVQQLYLQARLRSLDLVRNTITAHNN